MTVYPAYKGRGLGQSHLYIRASTGRGGKRPFRSRGKARDNIG